MSNGWTWGSSFLDMFRDRPAHNRRQPARRARLQVEQLEDRWMPSTLDLTAAGASGDINGALFQQVANQPTGTGVIQSFVRVQSQGAKQTVEQGYNTDARPVQFDEKTSPPFERSLQLSDVQTLTDGGVTYRVFLLDINQKHSDPLLSLDELRIYVSPTSGSLTGYDSTTHTLAGLTAVYDMGDNWVKLDASLNHGSGSGDMLLYVPDAVFGGGNPYVYLYSKFGVNNATNGGFEEWAPAVGPFNPPPPPVVQPASISGVVYQDLDGNGVFDVNFDAGLGGAILTLTNSQNQVVATTTSNPDGTYSFTGVPPGTYTLAETPPQNFGVAAFDNIGTVNGVSDGFDNGNGLMSGIVLASGNNGISYNFGHFSRGGDG